MIQSTMPLGVGSLMLGSDYLIFDIIGKNDDIKSLMSNKEFTSQFEHNLKTFMKSNAPMCKEFWIDYDKDGNTSCYFLNNTEEVKLELPLLNDSPFTQRHNRFKPTIKNIILLTSSDVLIDKYYKKFNFNWSWSEKKNLRRVDVI